MALGRYHLRLFGRQERAFDTCPALDREFDLLIAPDSKDDVPIGGQQRCPDTSRASSIFTSIFSNPKPVKNH